jgi:hypothetical protein
MHYEDLLQFSGESYEQWQWDRLSVELHNTFHIKFGSGNRPASVDLYILCFRVQLSISKFQQLVIIGQPRSDAMLEPTNRLHPPGVSWCVFIYVYETPALSNAPSTKRQAYFGFLVTRPS